MQEIESNRTERILLEYVATEKRRNRGSKIAMAAAEPDISVTFVENCLTLTMSQNLSLRVWYREREREILIRWSNVFLPYDSFLDINKPCSLS